MIKKIKPYAGQESVWDYPRPPRLEKVNKEIKIIFNNETIVKTNSAYRVLETSHPPVYYIPTKDIKMEFLLPGIGNSFCEWKGRAAYFSVCPGDQCVQHAAWTYPEPLQEFEAIRNYLAFYPDRLECYVDGERVRAQAGSFYGGWITAEIVGPFKGEPGTSGW